MNPNRTSKNLLQVSAAHLLYIQLFFLTMSLLDQLDAQHRENNLESIFGVLSLDPEHSSIPANHLDESQQKNIYATYNWIWNDEEPLSTQPLSTQQVIPLEEQKGIDEMKAARSEQQHKVKQFMLRLKPLSGLTRKTSFESKSQIGSPKKKKIKKLVSFK